MTPRPRMTAAEILDHLAECVGHVDRRPRMYAHDAEGLDLALWIYHSLWARIAGETPRFDDAHLAQHKAAGVGASNFARGYLHLRDGAEAPAEADVVRFVVEQWKAIDARLGLVVPEPGEKP